VDVPIETVREKKVNRYIDHLLAQRKHPKTINCHLTAVRKFYDFLIAYEIPNMDNPVRTGSCLRQPKPLPKYLTDEEVLCFLDAIHNARDKALFTLMLRTGMRVSEVANLSFTDIDFRRGRILIREGKGRKDRIVYISKDVVKTFRIYLKSRPSVMNRYVFLVECEGHECQAYTVDREPQKQISNIGSDLDLSNV